jgi:phosphate transport system protein
MAEQIRHISSCFDQALYGLKNDTLMMSSLTDRIFQNAMSALLKRDTDLCYQVIADDEEVDVLEKQIDEEGVRLLIRFQPVASDLRAVISAMKIGGHLERIADESVTIARRAKKLNFEGALQEVALLEPPQLIAWSIFRDSIRVFADGDCEMARNLKFKDRELDAMTNEVIERLTSRISLGSRSAQSYLDLIFVARALERIGDHATAIAEESFWRDQGDDIRRSYPPKKTNSYDTSPDELDLPKTDR